ncbi:MAG: tetratricopeptide repeat protein [Planctomycetaceae bacterium]
MSSLADQHVRRPGHPALWCIGYLCFAGLTAGCGSTQGTIRGASVSDGSDEGRMRAFGWEPGWARRRLRMDDVSIADVQGPEERRLRTVTHERGSRDVAEAPTADVAALFARLKKADDLYDEGEYAQAEQIYRVVRDEATPHRGLRKGLFNRHQFQEELEQSPIEEDAIFGVAQCEFMQGKLANAEETYAALLREYPSTRHLDSVSRQLFRIAREWLGFPDSNDSEIVQVAYGDKAPTVEQRRDRKAGWVPNFSDKSRPRFDVNGRALGALRLIWLHDAAGPLADDALMMAANYHTREGDFVAAAQHYRLLQEQFPNSPHFKDSLLLGSHVLLASYNGAGYDPSPLEQSKQLKLMALQYPDLDREDRARLEEELDKITEAEIEPLWKNVQFYRTKRQPESVLLYANMIINKYPNSRYARMAADVRSELTGGQPLPSGWPYVSQPPVAKTQANEPAATDGAADVTQPEAAGEARRYLPRFMRPVEKQPELQPIEPDSAATSNQTEAATDLQSSGRVRLQSPPPYPSGR